MASVNNPWERDAEEEVIVSEARGALNESLDPASGKPALAHRRQARAPADAACRRRRAGQELEVTFDTSLS